MSLLLLYMVYRRFLRIGDEPRLNINDLANLYISKTERERFLKRQGYYYLSEPPTPLQDTHLLDLLGFNFGFPPPPSSAPVLVPLGVQISSLQAPILAPLHILHFWSPNYYAIPLPDWLYGLPRLSLPRATFTTEPGYCKRRIGGSTLSQAQPPRSRVVLLAVRFRTSQSYLIPDPPKKNVSGDFSKESVYISRTKRLIKRNCKAIFHL